MSVLPTVSESIAQYEADIKWERAFIKRLQSLREKFWDNLETYAGIGEWIEREEANIVYYRRCILQLGLGERKW